MVVDDCMLGLRKPRQEGTAQDVATEKHPSSTGISSKCKGFSVADYQSIDDVSLHARATPRARRAANVGSRLVMC